MGEPDRSRETFQAEQYQETLRKTCNPICNIVIETTKLTRHCPFSHWPSPTFQHPFACHPVNSSLTQVPGDSVLAGGGNAQTWRHGPLMCHCCFEVGVEGFERVKDLCLPGEGSGGSGRWTLRGRRPSPPPNVTSGLGLGLCPSVVAWIVDYHRQLPRGTSQGSVGEGGGEFCTCWEWPSCLCTPWAGSGGFNF